MLTSMAAVGVAYAGGAGGGGGEVGVVGGGRGSRKWRRAARKRDAALPFVGTAAEFLFAARWRRIFAPHRVPPGTRAYLGLAHISQRFVFCFFSFVFFFCFYFY
jgi:hypothetical protein